ncbi:MAG: response regulator [Acidobacteria bacterium]|nr:response regulator [Acidobacteriota bacterium]
MSRILLADDSPHAQRMGERLLRDEGHEVVTITDGDTVFVRLPDVDPDVLIVDANLPMRNGYEITRFVKGSSFYRHAKVLLTGSVAEPVDEKLARDAGADGMLHKPFESKALLSLVNPLAEKAAELRELRPAGPPPPPPGDEPKFISGAVNAEPEPEFAVDPEADKPVAPMLAPLGVKPTPESEPDPAPPSGPAVSPTVSEEERVRAAVTLALDAAMPRMIDELTQQVLRALHSK